LKLKLTTAENQTRLYTVKYSYLNFVDQQKFITKKGEGENKVIERTSKHEFLKKMDNYELCLTYND